MKRWHVSFEIPGSDLRDFTHVARETQEEAVVFVEEHHGEKPVAVEEPIAAHCTRDCGYEKRQAEAKVEDDEKQKHMVKIRKLLSLATSPNEAEATLAMQKAHELCLLHEINMEEALKSGEAQPVDKTVHIDREMQNKTNGNAWRRQLINAIAKSMFCGYVVDGFRLYGQKGGWGPQKQVPYDRHAIVGTRAHIIEVKAMAEYLIKVCEQIANDVSLDYPRNQRARFVNSFLVGISLRLSRRLYERRMEAEKGMRTSDGRNLPALIDNYKSHDEANKQKVDETYGELKQSRGPQVNDKIAQMEGWKAGENVSLDKQIGGGHGNHKQIGHC